MKQYSRLVFILFSLFLFLGCNTRINNDNSTDESDKDVCITGYNINWSFLPKLNENILKAASSLNPKLIRYPGGTVSKTWDWRSGTTTKAANRIPHTLDDLLLLKEGTGANVTFVLNTISSTLENQIEMLKTAQDIGIDIKYIEMGNEHYLGKGNNEDDAGNHQDNIKAFPTGKEYAKFVNRWSDTIRKEFPDAKIGITMLGRKNDNQRLSTWNSLITEYIDADSFDAYIYHVYVRAEDSIELDKDSIAQIIKERTDILESSMIDDDSKEVWITEYGVHADTIEDTVTLTSALADYLEEMSDIALPQVLYTKSDRTFFSLLTPPDADDLTPLGEMFAKRKKSED